MVNNTINDEIEYLKKKYGNFKSTRHAKIEEYQEIELPRLGRRESEPHSLGIMRIYDILTTNFPEDRTLMDLHHYFYVKGEKIDIQFDLTYFKNFKLNYTLSSYDASKFNNRIPDMAINILSKSTYLKDLGYTTDICQELKIPVYIIFSTHDISVSFYKPPFLRAHILENNKYNVVTVNGEIFDENNNLIEKNIIKTSPILPFNIGLLKLSTYHESGTPNYTLALLNPKTNELLKTKSELEKERADREKERADREKERADKLEKLLEEYRKKLKL